MNTSKNIMIMCIVFVIAAIPVYSAKAETIETAFTYQGRLIDNNEPADGLYDFQFKLYDAAGEGNQLNGDINTPDVDVNDGYFTVELDFGFDVFDGNARWLEVGVRPGEQNDPDVYTVLLPRQEISVVPYALQTRGIFVDDTGNVGIGTTNPSERLKVNGTVKSTDGFVAGDTTAYQDGWIRVYHLTPNDLIFKVGGTGPSNSRTQGIEIMRLTETGRLGIGTPNPTEKLDVNGTVKATAFVGDGSMLTGIPETDPTVLASVKDGITWNEVSDRPAGLDDGDDIGITSETDPTVLYSVKDGITWSEVSDRPAGLDDGDQVGITSETDPQVGGNNENYVPKWDGSALVTGTIYDNGNVGIGTNSPGQKLDVGGYIRTNQALLGPSSTGKLHLYGDFEATSGITIQDNGNVGIGTTSPAARLHLIGPPTFQVSLIGDVVGLHNGGDTQEFRFYKDDVEDPEYYNNPIAAALVTIKNTGNVGIGTTSPSLEAKLEVAGQVKITGGSPGVGKILTSADATGLASWQTPPNSDSGRQLFTSSGTFTAPAEISKVYITAVAGGGGGGGLVYVQGGGGGETCMKYPYSVTGGNTYSVTVGNGGDGGYDSSPWGSDGGNTVFGTLTLAGGRSGGYGGAGGGISLDGSNGSSGNGGSGGGMGIKGGNGGGGTVSSGGGGGGTIFGRGGAGGNSEENGSNGTGYGSGGGGVGFRGVGYRGGNGKPGFVLVEW